MNGIIIYSETTNEHIPRQTDIFRRVGKANLKIQPDKCEFFRKEVTYLEHLNKKSKRKQIISEANKLLPTVHSKLCRSIKTSYESTLTKQSPYFLFLLRRCYSNIKKPFNN